MVRGQIIPKMAGDPNRPLGLIFEKLMMMMMIIMISRKQRDFNVPESERCNGRKLMQK